MTLDNDAKSSQRLALDFQKNKLELLGEKKRSDALLAKLIQTEAELERVKNSATREIDSRLQAEEALGESQERLLLALDAAGLALWDCRAPFEDVYLSARWGELLGDIALEGSWKISDIASRVHPEDVDRVRHELRQLLSCEARRVSIDYRFRAQGEWIWLETHAMVAEIDALGGASRVMGTQANITRRKRVEEKAAQARIMAEQASRAKSEFLANMSHEIRTPLNAIMGLNQLLLGSQQSVEHRQWLQLMDDSSRVLLNLLNDVLDFSRIEAGKLHLEQIDFSIRDLFESTSKTYLEQARLKSIKLNLSLPPGLPAKIIGDPLRIRQVLTNLLSNAVKFTPNGGVISLEANVVHEKDRTPKLVFKIADNGIGIAPGQHQAMFEAFTQADTSTARQHGGSGLGLAICSTLVKMMGGTIRLESSLGRGCMFEVQIPMKDVPSSIGGRGVSEKIPAGSPLTESDRFEGVRVIVAEDNPVNVRLMCDSLKQVGCDVHVAQDGGDAVNLWREVGPDLVLMDVQMPGVNGLVATARIRELERDMRLVPVPILAVTANAMAGDQEAYLAAGMSGYVAKPIDLQKLFQAMSEALLERHPARSAHEERGSALSGSQGAAPAAPRKRSANVQQTLERKMMSLRRALDRKDAGAAQVELETLSEGLSVLEAERALRICRGLDMARHAEEWGLFSRALPLLEAEIVSLIERLNGGADVTK